MKKSIILGVTILSTLLLTACGGNNAKSSSESSHVSKASRQNKKARQQSSDKTKSKSISERNDSSNKAAATSSQSVAESQSEAESSSTASAQLSSQAAASSIAVSQSAANSSNIAKQSPTSNNGSQRAATQSTSGISMDENTLTGFLNKYGESPAAYKIDHGMSVQQALNSTPDNMLSSGEIQDKAAMQQGYLNSDGSPTEKQVSVQNDTNSANNSDVNSDYGQ